VDPDDPDLVRHRGPALLPPQPPDQVLARRLLR
jgi:hypothetical protein